MVTQKRADFELFKQIVFIKANNRRLSLENFQNILGLRANLNLGQSEKLQNAFPNILQVPRPLFTNQILLTFYITQHSRDTLLMESLIRYLNCGQVLKRSSQSAVDFKVGRFVDITSKVIPFLQKYPLQSVKQKDFLDWVEASFLIGNKEHLTIKGLEKINIIKDGMNKKKRKIRFSIRAKLLWI